MSATFITARTAAAAMSGRWMLNAIRAAQTATSWSPQPIVCQPDEMSDGTGRRRMPRPSRPRARSAPKRPFVLHPALLVPPRERDADDDERDAGGNHGPQCGPRR